MKYGLTTGLMISSFVFALSVCLFCFGCIFIYMGNERIVWLYIVIGSFILSIISDIICLWVFLFLFFIISFFGLGPSADILNHS